MTALQPATVHVERCDLSEPDAARAWDDFVHAHAAHLVFHTASYARFLARVVPRSRGCHLVARDTAGRVRGILPAVLQEGGPFGPVLNALPFFGGHGAPLVDDTAGVAVRDALLDAFDDLATAERVASSTIVTNPLDAAVADAVRARGGDAFDERIGQLTPLPDPSEGPVDGQLMARYHQKTRTVVRRALERALTIERTDASEAYEALAELHAENMRAIGGVAKPPAVFRALAESFAPVEGRTLWVARSGGDIAAMLLTLHTPGVVEYFTPAVRAEARPLQPLSALIHHAMCDGAERRARWWNWGGTWTTQTGVYQFKRRWGTRDLRYHYVTRIRDARIRGATPAALLAGYPFSYVLPFGALAA